MSDPERIYQTTLDTMSFVWNFKIFTVENGEVISVGLMFKGLLFLSLGYWVAGWLSRLVDRRLLSRMKIDPPIRATLKKLTFYFFLLIVSLSILHLIHFPVAVFTVLGGALAIGVGFGSQNIVNNFISGLIIMIDQPIRSGDVIDIGGLKGKVEEIGGRSTLILCEDNTHVIVPNSKFLEGNVVNWTLSDDTVRVKIAVGVAYGSDLRLAEKLLIDIGKQHPRAIREREPMVLFQDFASSSLNLELLVWAKIEGLDSLHIMTSEIRFAIDQAFRTHHISIAFPQLDVHLPQAIKMDLVKVETIN